jgi:hypothetical protein
VTVKSNDGSFPKLQLFLMSSAPPDVLGATHEMSLRGTIRDSLAEWTKCALGSLDQEPAAHHQVLIRELEDISTGANTRLIVLMPPGSAKSTYAFVNTNLWGAYVNTPATAGTWYAWTEGINGSLPTVYPTPFTVI